jgi:tRNA-dihydrouridine synthase A
MITTGAILNGKGDYLSFNSSEHPLVLQLGGSDPIALAECALRAEQAGYDEINLNVGCPSDRVQNGRFGACLMAEPNLVADCVAHMQKMVKIPITVKSRIGIDDFDSYEFLSEFIDTVSQTGCKHFIIHARKAWLSGLSPKQNREIPPLDYSRVYQIKRDFPELTISINGGINTLEETTEHLNFVDGVMIGREIYQNPYLLADVDNKIWHAATPQISRADVIEGMCDYIDEYITEGGKIRHVVRHMLGLCNGLSGGRRYRRYLSENASKDTSDSTILREAFSLVSI